MKILNSPVWRPVESHSLNKGGMLEAYIRFARWQLASVLMFYPIAFPFVDNTRLRAQRHWSSHAISDSFDKGMRM